MLPHDPFVTDGTTFINQTGFVFAIAMCILLIVLPRRYALLPIVALICYMTMGMRVVVGGLNFTMIRILLLSGWLRLIIRGELTKLKLNPLDKTILAWVSVNIVANTLLWQTFEAFKNRLGFAYDALGFYFMFRFLMRDFNEVARVIKTYAVFILPVAALMIWEKMTGRDPFAMFGGVPQFTAIRDGALRCQGPFAHPILAGTFGATLMPLFGGLWWQKGKNRIYGLLSVVASAIVTVTSASSGPILTFLCGILALTFWKWRRHMRSLRWGIVLFLVGLQTVMHAPIWFLIGKMDIVAGSTGYHRALLIDRAVANLPDWWLVGTKSTEVWSYGLFDVTNSYIANGVNGGLLAMILFITMIVLAFKGVGRAIKAGAENQSKQNLQIIWALGAALFAHAVAFLSVSYFDQNFVNWYLLLAAISTCTGSLLMMPRFRFFASLRDQKQKIVNSLPGGSAGLNPDVRASCVSVSEVQSGLRLSSPPRQRF